MTSMARSPQEGKSAWLGGLGVEIKISSQQTGGVFALVELTLEPGRLVWPHVHTREDEYTYVLEGEIGLRIGDQIIEATAGGTVVKPRGIPHTFWTYLGSQIGQKNGSHIGSMANMVSGARAGSSLI